MILVIITSAVCLAAATLMYTPKMRSFRHYRPVALFFLFEAVWILADYIFTQISPANVFMPIIHYIGLILVGVYFLLSLIFNSGKKNK